MSSELVAALITGLVTMIVAVLAHQRANRTIALEREALAEREKDRVESQQRKQVETITQAYEAVLGQLRSEIDRLIGVRHAETEGWRQREESLNTRIAELRLEVDAEKQRANRLEMRLELVEAELHAVEKRAGWRNEAVVDAGEDVDGEG